MMRYPTLLALIVALPTHGLKADEDQPKKQKEREISSATVVISATKTERTEKEIANTVSLKTAKDIEQKLIFNILDLIKFEPGVNISTNPDRQGATSYSIRGIDNNRVLILVDGTNLPDGASAGRVFGSDVMTGHSFSRDFVDLDSLKRVEILRGPSSALYGSDAIGGVVSYTTKDPKDYLANRTGLHSSIKAAYASAYDGFSSTVTVAGANGNWGGLLLGTTRTGHETKPAIGDPNQITYRSNNLLGKLDYSPNADHTFNLSAQSFERHNDINLVSAVGPITMPPGKIDTSHGNDTSRRNQFSLDHVFDDDSAFFQRISWRAFYQQAYSLERTDEQRTVTMPPPGSTMARHGDSRFQQEIWGLRSQAEKHFMTTNGWVHKLLFGLDISHTETSRPYDGSEYNISTPDNVTNELDGVTYPRKIMPDSTTTSGGVFIQGEIYTPSSAWAVIPGLRFDYYNLNPHIDKDFENSRISNKPGFEDIDNLPVTSVSNFAVSPKIGIIRTLDPIWSLYGQYSNGFRNPPYDNINMAMTMYVRSAMGTTSGRIFVPNPDIGPERCNSFELGLRGDNQTGWNFSAATFYNNYTDFITHVELPPINNIARLQYQNLQKVRIYGAEFKGSFTFLNNFIANASFAYAKGDDLVEKQPLDSIAPIKTVLAFGYQDSSLWGIDMLCTLSAKNNKALTYQGTSSDGKEPFQAPGYALFDLMGHLNIKTKNNSWRVQAGIFNILDKTYWRWEDVRGFTADNPPLRYSQPGRNMSASITYSWK